MPTTPHVEEHFSGTATVRDVVIGMSDGLTVPFALAAGLSGAVMSTGIVVTAGLAEIVAGSIAMGLGGYLAAKTESEHYQSELRREVREVEVVPDREEEEVREIFVSYGLAEEQAHTVTQALMKDKTKWVEFMMRFELGLEAPDPKRARVSALTIAFSYIAGGLVPLLPYMLVANMMNALWISVGVTLLALFIFGYVKGRYTGINPWRGGGQTIVVGGLAAACAFVIARAIS